jgi:hypothetical protein
VGLKRLLAAAFALSVLAGQVRAQDQVRSAKLVADFSGQEGTAEVQIEYRLSLEGPGDIMVELLGFADANVSEFRVDGIEQPTTLIQVSGSRVGASVPVTPDASGIEHVLALRYQVNDAVETTEDALRARIPVLSVSLPPVDGSSDVFRAEIRIPDTWAVSEGFPTGLRRSEDGSYTVSLPVVPALVSIRARSDGAWRPGLPLALDLVAVIFLIGFSYRGWRHLSEVAG